MIIVHQSQEKAVFVDENKTEQFDSTYPQELNGIINEQQFGQSIDRINKTISTRHSSICCKVFTTIFVALVLTGVATSITMTRVVFGHPRFLWIDVGPGFLLFTGFCLCLRKCCIFIHLFTILKKAINEESEKYSSRSNNRCIWRLAKPKDGFKPVDSSSLHKFIPGVTSFSLHQNINEEKFLHCLASH